VIHPDWHYIVSGSLSLFSIYSHPPPFKVSQREAKPLFQNYFPLSFDKERGLKGVR